MLNFFDRARLRQRMLQIAGPGSRVFAITPALDFCKIKHPANPTKHTSSGRVLGLPDRLDTSKNQIAGHIRNGQSSDGRVYVISQRRMKLRAMCFVFPPDRLPVEIKVDALFKST